MSDRTLKESLQAFGINRALGMMRTDPEENLPKLLSWVDKIDKDDAMLPQRKFLHSIIDDPDNIWYQFILSLWDDIDDDVRVKFFENFIINAGTIGYSRQNKSREKYPWAILMDPTSACNLKCTGCWAAEYGDKLGMDFDTLDKIVTQGKELGTYTPAASLWFVRTISSSFAKSTASVSSLHLLTPHSSMKNSQMRC